MELHIVIILLLINLTNCQILLRSYSSEEEPLWTGEKWLLETAELLPLDDPLCLAVSTRGPHAQLAIIRMERGALACLPAMAIPNDPIRFYPAKSSSVIVCAQRMVAWDDICVEGRELGKDNLRALVRSIVDQPCAILSALPLPSDDTSYSEESDEPCPPPT